jgi:HAE1 family hydrophobic/amphiphilic exporter-1
VKVIFFPGGDNDFFYVEIEKPQGTTLATTDLATRAVEEILYDNPDIASFVTTIGSGSTFGGGGSGSKLANITINLHEKREKTSLQIAEEVRASLRPIRDVEWRVTEPQNGPPTGAPIVITFRGDDLDNLERAVARGEKLLKDIPGSRDTTTSMKDDNIEFVFTLDKAKAHELGFTPTMIAGILRTSLTGSKATTINKDADDIDVVVKLNLGENTGDPDASSVGTVDDIRQIPIQTRQGTVLLGSLLDVRLQKSNSSIRREDRERIATISGYITEGSTAVEVTKAFKDRVNELNLPSDVRVSFGGETEEVDRSFQEMGIALLAGLLLMLAILVLEFNSFRYTLYLLLTVPLSLIGVLSGLAITGEPLSFPSMLGVIALAGIIINHAIILLDSMYHLIQNPEGRTIEDIVVDSAAVRLRPIFLTTITTVLGMVPLAGASDLWGPLAFSVMFGLMFAMILTLVLIPLLFYRWPGKKFRANSGSHGHVDENQLVISLPKPEVHKALPPHTT